MTRSFMVRALCAVLLAGSLGAYAQQYTPLSRPLAAGQAPHMQFQVLQRSGQQTTYAVIFGTGDELLAGLTEFAEAQHVRAARITGIGAVENATLGWFDPKVRLYRTIAVSQQAEVLSLLGDIALYRGKPVVHAHVVVGYPDGSAHGGHLIEAHVRPTLEVIVTAYPNALQKKLDSATGLALIDPGLQVGK